MILNALFMQTDYHFIPSHYDFEMLNEVSRGPPPPPPLPLQAARVRSRTPERLLRLQLQIEQAIRLLRFLSNYCYLYSAFRNSPSHFGFSRSTRKTTVVLG